MVHGVNAVCVTPNKNHLQLHVTAYVSASYFPFTLHVSHHLLFRTYFCEMVAIYASNVTDEVYYLWKILHDNHICVCRVIASSGTNSIQILHIHNTSPDKKSKFCHFAWFLQRSICIQLHIWGKKSMSRLDINATKNVHILYAYTRHYYMTAAAFLVNYTFVYLGMYVCIYIPLSVYTQMFGIVAKGISFLTRCFAHFIWICMYTHFVMVDFYVIFCHSCCFTLLCIVRFRFHTCICVYKYVQPAKAVSYFSVIHNTKLMHIYELMIKMAQFFSFYFMTMLSWSFYYVTQLEPFFVFYAYVFIQSMNNGLR